MDELSESLQRQNRFKSIAKVVKWLGILLGLGGLMINLTSMALIGLTLFLIGSYKESKHQDQMQNQVASTIIDDLLKKEFSDVQYPFQGSLPVAKLSWTLNLEGDYVRKSQSIYATYLNHSFELSNYTLVKEEDYYNEETNMWEKMRKEMSHGQCLIGHFTTSITCPIKISPRKKSLFTSKGILMNEEEFDRLYKVECDDESQVAKVLTLARMEELIHFRQNESKKIYLSFFETGEFYFIVETKENLFDFNHQTDPFYLKNKFLNELAWYKNVLGEFCK